MNKKLFLVGAIALTLALGLFVQNTNAQTTELQFTITDGTNTCSWDAATYNFGSQAVDAAESQVTASSLGYACVLYNNAATVITLGDDTLSGATYTIASSNLTGDANGFAMIEDGTLAAGASWTTSNSTMAAQELYSKVLGQVGNIEQDFDTYLTVPAGQPADVYAGDLTISLS